MIPIERFFFGVESFSFKQASFAASIFVYDFDMIFDGVFHIFLLNCAKIGSGTAPQFYPIISVVVDPIESLGGRTVSATLPIHLLSGGPILAYIGIRSQD